MPRQVWMALLQIVIILSALQLAELEILQDSTKERLINAVHSSGTVLKEQSQTVGALGEAISHLSKLPRALTQIVSDLVGAPQVA